MSCSSIIILIIFLIISPNVSKIIKKGFLTKLILEQGPKSSINVKVTKINERFYKSRGNIHNNIHMYILNFISY